MLTLDSISERDEKRIYNFCAERNYVIYLTEVLGDWQMEIETEVASHDEISALMGDLGRAFSDKILQHEVLEVTKEHKMNYFPVADELVRRFRAAEAGKLSKAQ
jgi:hypothetical protein